jgi:hypothetical protein
MNVDQTTTRVPVREPGQPVSFPRRAIQRVTRAPAALRSPAARWAVNVLAVVGAGLMVWSAVIHLQLWSDGYRSISVIGPLFLIQGIGSIVLALLLVALRRVFLLAASAVLMAGTGLGLLLSASVGLFGFKDSLAIPEAQTSLMVEFIAAALLAGAAAVLAAGPRSRLARP